MDIGTASALSLYTFQNTARSSGQPAAVLQALTQVYNDSMAAAGSDPSSRLLMSAGMAPVARAMDKLATTNGDGTASSTPVPIENLKDALTFGGLNTASAAALFADSSTASKGTGFESALTAQATLALAAYQAGQTYQAAAQPTSAYSASLSLIG
jgi:hypothetical protein